VARTPLILVLSMAKTSSFHPGSPNPSNKQIMAPRKKKVDGNDQVTKTKIARKKRTSPTKPGKSNGSDLLSTRRKHPPEQLEKSNDSDLPLTRWKDPPKPQPQQRMPSLRPVRGNRTPAPSPPKVLNLPAPFHPIDHTHHESPINSAVLSKVAAAINTDGNDDVFSIHLQGSQSTIRSVG
jgi:hypothetical protein